jgi:hypothetical protein
VGRRLEPGAVVDAAVRQVADGCLRAVGADRLGQVARRLVVLDEDHDRSPLGALAQAV